MLVGSIASMRGIDSSSSWSLEESLFSSHPDPFNSFVKCCNVKRAIVVYVLVQYSCDGWFVTLAKYEFLKLGTILFLKKNIFFVDSLKFIFWEIGDHWKQIKGRYHSDFSKPYRFWIWVCLCSCRESVISLGVSLASITPSFCKDILFQRTLFSAICCGPINYNQIFTVFPSNLILSFWCCSMMVSTESSLSKTRRQ